MAGKLYLIPNFIGGQSKDLLPLKTVEQIHLIDCFIVEKEKTARAFFKQIEHPIPQSDFIIHELDKHQDYAGYKPFFQKHIQSVDIGLLSEAGLPAIADPGSDIVKHAHLKDIKVRPLAGTSSIFLALMGSGMSGQQFTFNGYLPINKKEKQNALRNLERNSRGHTQIFMETPYRNNEMMKTIKETLNSESQFAFACDLESMQELIVSVKVKDLDPTKFDLHKRPCIFMIQS